VRNGDIETLTPGGGETAYGGFEALRRSVDQFIADFNADLTSEKPMYCGGTAVVHGVADNTVTGFPFGSFYHYNTSFAPRWGSGLGFSIESGTFSTVLC
jgi:hypothetical protein